VTNPGHAENQTRAASSRLRATTVAAAVIIGMLVGFGATLFILRRTGYCPLRPLCDTSVGYFALAFIPAPFLGLGFGYLSLRMLEKQARMRRDS